MDALLALGQFVDYALRTLAAIPAAIVRRPGETLRQFERVLWGSLPLVALAGLSVGLVTWAVLGWLAGQFWSKAA